LGRSRAEHEGQVMDPRGVMDRERAQSDALLVRELCAGQVFEGQRAHDRKIGFPSFQESGFGLKKLRSSDTAGTLGHEKPEQRMGAMIGEIEEPNSQRSVPGESPRSLSMKTGLDKLYFRAKRSSSQLKARPSQHRVAKRPPG